MREALQRPASFYPVALSGEEKLERLRQLNLAKALALDYLIDVALREAWEIAFVTRPRPQ